MIFGGVSWAFFVRNFGPRCSMLFREGWEGQVVLWAPRGVCGWARGWLSMGRVHMWVLGAGRYPILGLQQRLRHVNLVCDRVVEHKLTLLLSVLTV